MYKKDDLIVYGSNGICRVIEAEMQEFTWMDKPKLYYTLQPLYKGLKIYAPADTRTLMRQAITKSQAQSLIDMIPLIKETLADEDKEVEIERQCKDLYNGFDCVDLLKTIGVLFVKNAKAADRGKRLSQEEQRLMESSETLLYGELAAALEISREEVKPYIDSRLAELQTN